CMKSAFNPATTKRPSATLMTYYTVTSLFLGPFFFLALIPLSFRFKTMRYAFDEQGVTQSYGQLFRTEKRLNYRRIQDIHVTSGGIQRWFGLTTVALYTASGSAGPEMTLEGIEDPEGLRNYLYTKSRGARGVIAVGPSEATSSDDEAMVLLREIRDALRGA